MAMTQIVDPAARASGLDPLSRRLTGLVNKIPVALRDALHGVWLGHPLHPMLAQLPVGAWTSAALVDVVALALPAGEGREGADRAARALLGIGLAAAPVTAAAGVTDWSKLLPEQQRVGLVHASANTLALTLLTASFVRRRPGGSGGRLLGLLGVTAAAAGAGIGGHLSYRWAAGANHAQDVPHVSPSDWTDVGALEEFEQRTPVLRHVGDTPVVVVRRGSTLTVLADHCSHLSGPLHEGRLAEDGGEDCIVCPWHGSSFALDDGSVRHGPATAPQPGFDVQVRDGVVRARVRPPA
jgi:nitrite reductase/ring-hydroxylating ferredoxin subunit/uncharacterized membrane protein